MADKTYLKTTLAIFAISVLLAQLTFAAPRRYEIIDLGTLGGDQSGASFINDHRQIVGSAYNQQGNRRATLFDSTGNGNNIDLGTLGGINSWACSINCNGQIVGFAENQQGYGRATLFDPTGSGKNIDLGTLGELRSNALSIDNSGQIVGYARNEHGYQRATLFDPTGGGNNIDLGTLGGIHSKARSINDRGQIVGNARIQRGYSHATLFDPTGGGNNIDLGTLGGSSSYARSINNLGQIVGWAANGSLDNRATLFDPTGGGKNIELGTLGGRLSWAEAINDTGQIVGAAENQLRDTRATLFDPTGSGNNIDLNTLIDPAYGWTLKYTDSINNHGLIVGTGVNPAGDDHAYLLIPKPAIIYVDDDASGNNNGSSWADAFNYLQDALTAAWSGDEIRVAQGTYKPDQGAVVTTGDREATFQLINGVALKGGYAGFGEPDPNAHDIELYETILTGDLYGDDGPDFANNGENSYHVVTGSGTNPTAVLDGLTITGGNANGSKPYWDGGGMYNYSGSPTVMNCIFKCNSANDDGGGMYNFESSPTLTNCSFNGNYAWMRGGGVFNLLSRPLLVKCTFTANFTSERGDGGGAYNNYSTPTMVECTFTNNYACDGGGMRNYFCSPILTNCTFRRNLAHLRGGGIDNYMSSLTLTNCMFSSNSASWGGGMSNSGDDNHATLNNCVFTGNYTVTRICDTYGGAICNSDKSSVTLDNCTFMANTAVDFGGTIYNFESSATFTNCILWQNRAPKGAEIAIVKRTNLPIPSTVTVDYSDVQGGTESVYIVSGSMLNWGTGNIDADPCFTEPGYWADTNDPNITVEPNDPSAIWVDGDYHLLPGSPCIDAGDPNYIPEPNETDLDGSPRVIGGRIDMGAYEFQSQLVLYVDADAAGANDGSSWADAFNYLQDALTAAYSGDEIRVAQGTYKPDQGAVVTTGDREATFQLINAVAIKGGYAGFGQPDPNARDIQLYETILSGDLNGDDGPDFANNGENSYHVVTGSGTNETAILDGFTITAGKANGSWLLHQDDGGGLSNYAGSPTIGNCTFTGNWAGWYGGGIYNEGSSPTLFNCTIRYNAARGSGSGMCNREGSNPTLTNCTFSWNVGLSYHDSFGVGMYNYESNPILSNCAFTGNSGSLGAGMYNYDSNPTLTSCTFTGNTVHEGGGGMRNLRSSPTLINCTFSGNWSDWYGVGGMESCCSSTPTLTNCILWSDMPGEISGPAVVTYSDVQGGWPGTGNIDADPCFVSPGYWNTNGTPDKYWDDFWVDGDYHLLSDSPCIDSGDPNYPYDPNETDLDGRPRVIGGRIDMGAYEYSPPIPAEARIAPRTINLASRGKWITCYISLPEDYSVADIDPNSVFLEDEIKAESLKFDKEQQVATARFTREKVQAILNVGDVELTITGQLMDGTIFEATDTIRVLNKAGLKSAK